jgi:hypothetical protein
MASLTSHHLSLAAGAFRPDDCDRDAALAGVGHHVGRPPEPPCWLPVPDGHQQAGVVHHCPASIQVGLLGGLGVLQGHYLNLIAKLLRERY